jgi:hypothetical protein
MAREMHTPAGAETGGTGTGYGPSYGGPSELRDGRGWLTFAAVLFMVAGVANALWGISALVNDDYFAADELLFGDLSMWGVFYLLLAAAQLAAAWLIIRGSSAGAILGIGLVILHATVALMSIAAYPLWTVPVLAIDGLIIYGLTVHGFEQEV